MEFHPLVAIPHSVGVGAQHSKSEVQSEQMNSIDMKNAEDMLIIAIELIHET